MLIKTTHPFLNSPKTMRAKRPSQGESRSILNSASPSNPNASTPDDEISNGEKKHVKLIPWEDIWTSLSIAQLRGNGDMIEVFYDTLFREAVFDDHGAWSTDLKKAT